MHVLRYAAAVLAAVLLTPPLAASAAPGPKPHEVRPIVGVTRQGQAYCFDRAITAGGIVVAGGRCYTFYLVHTTQGGFLGFGPPGPPMIPPGQLVRLNTPAGAKLKGRLFYLVPLRFPVGAVAVKPGTLRIPVGTFQHIEVSVGLFGGRVVITLPRTVTDSDRELELPFTQP